MQLPWGASSRRYGHEPINSPVRPLVTCSASIRDFTPRITLPRFRASVHTSCGVKTTSTLSSRPAISRCRREASQSGGKERRQLKLVLPSPSVEPPGRQHSTRFLGDEDEEPLSVRLTSKGERV